jgi:hypothetical protein
MGPGVAQPVSASAEETRLIQNRRNWFIELALHSDARFGLRIAIALRCDLEDPPVEQQFQTEFQQASKSASERPRLGWTRRLRNR